MPPLISLIIVNFNAGPLLARCLDSVRRQTVEEIEVIVVDNASKDNSLEAVQERPWVRLVTNANNRGFAAAQNQGLKMAQGKLLMPLNFDIHLMPNFLECAISAMEGNPAVGTVSGKIMRMHPDGTWTDQFDNAGLLLSRRRIPLHRGLDKEDRGQYQNRELVFGALGAAAVFRREMLEDVAFQGQFFDESFFTWYEDVDIDWRARLRGWDCLYVPEAVAYHIGDPQKNQISAFAVRHGIRNRWQMILSNDCLHCLGRDARWLVINEVELLRHVLKYRFLGAYLLALLELLFRMPGILKKRAWVRGRAQRRCLPEYLLSP